MGTEKPLLIGDPFGATLYPLVAKKKGRKKPYLLHVLLLKATLNNFIPIQSTSWEPVCVVQRQSSHFQQCALPADAIVSKQQAEFNLKHKLCIPDLQELLNKAQKTNSWGKRYRRWDREPKRNRYLMVKSK